MEKRENNLMKISDRESRLENFRNVERKRECSERDNMSREEHFQTHTSPHVINIGKKNKNISDSIENNRFFDNFWGLDIHAYLIKEEKRKKVEKWESETEELRKICVKIKLIEPYSEEIKFERKGKFNISTQKIIL